MGRDKLDYKTLIRALDGRPLKSAGLPPPDLKRWVPKRKAEVVAAVRGGVISLEAACQRYALTVEEFLSWENALTQYGLEGLRVGDIQHHRHVN
ncbi:MAG TPA: DUF1153 domain-containing protein [Rhizomicrobium sp.]|jgi:hypothetical protein